MTVPPASPTPTEPQSPNISLKWLISLLVMMSWILIPVFTMALLQTKWNQAILSLQEDMDGIVKDISNCLSASSATYVSSTCPRWMAHIMEASLKTKRTW